MGNGPGKGRGVEGFHSFPVSSTFFFGLSVGDLLGLFLLRDCASHSLLDQRQRQLRNWATRYQQGSLPSNARFPLYRARKNQWPSTKT